MQDLGLRKSAASKLCSLYERIVIELKFPTETLQEAPWTNLYTALPMMTSKAEAEAAMLKASLLTNKELMLERYEHKHGRECQHEHGVLMKKCLDCGTYARVYENEDV